MPGAPEQPVFYYDLGQPECYLVAEQVMSALAVVPEWEPVLGASVQPGAARGVDRALIERLAAELGLQPVRWPPEVPADTRQAMLAATNAKHIGRAVAFSLAAFRQAFAAGRDLSEADNVLIAAAACELHPNAVLRGIETKAVKDKLRAATDEAISRGVVGIPTVAVGDQLFWGDDRLEEAVAASLRE